MGKKTGISWAESTHNFWIGCKKISSGCMFCYAERDMKRFGKDFNVLQRVKNFNKPLDWKEPRTIFVNSWSDFFIRGREFDDVSLQSQIVDWRLEAWEIMLKANWHNYIILTKRAEFMRDWFGRNKVPNHIWPGVTVESEEYVDRISYLKQIDSIVKIISFEPLLSRIENLNILDEMDHCQLWIITGGESGPQARPCNLDWVREIRDYCHKRNISFHHKQHGGWEREEGCWGGRTLDGVIWNQLPKVKRI